MIVAKKILAIPHFAIRAASRTSVLRTLHRETHTRKKASLGLASKCLFSRFCFDYLNLRTEIRLLSDGLISSLLFSVIYLRLQTVERPLAGERRNDEL